MRPRVAFAVGVIVFASASLACGLAPSFEVLVAARCVQAVGAALIVTAALDLLSQVEGSNEVPCGSGSPRVCWVQPSGRLRAGSSHSCWAGSRSSSCRCLSPWCSCSRSPGCPRSAWPLRPESLARRERRAAARRRRARRSSLPRRPAARGRVGDVPGRCRRRRHGHAADSDRRRPVAAAVARPYRALPAA